MPNCQLPVFFYEKAKLIGVHLVIRKKALCLSTKEVVVPDSEHRQDNWDLFSVEIFVKLVTWMMKVVFIKSLHVGMFSCSFVWANRDIDVVNFQVQHQNQLRFTLSLPGSIMETCSVVLTFEPVDEILWRDHSNETSLAVLLHGIICCFFLYFAK